MKKSYLLLLHLFLLLFTIKGEAQGSWAPIASGTTTNLLGVSVPSSTVCYVCGATGTIRKTINGGTSWFPLSTGTGQSLYSILFQDILLGYVVGDNGTALKTIDGGVTWTPMTIGTTSNLRFVYFIDANNGYISGASGIILKTTNAGSTWTTLTTGTSSILNSVYFTSTSVGYAVGATGTIIKTINSGTSWTPLTSGTSSPLYGVYFTAAANAITSGDNGVILQTTTSGTTWGPITSGTTDILSGIDFIDANNGFTVGGNIALNTGNILQTINGGNTWTSYLPGTSRLTKVGYYDLNLCYAVGLNGTILQWTVPLPPDAQFTSSAPGCTGQLENFYSTMVTSGVTHSWNFGSSAIPATSTLNNPVGVTYSTSGAKVITHIVTTALGSDTVTNIITINPSPLSSFGSTPAGCAGSSVSFFNTGSVGVGTTYSWDFGSGASPLVSTAQNPTGIMYTTGGTKIITFNVTNQYGCTSATTNTFTIDSLPMVNAGTDTTICFNTSIQLGAASISGMTYSWSPASTLSNSSISNPVASPTSAVTQYILTATKTATGCINKDTVTISMLPALFANAGSDVSICKNDSVQLGTGLILGQTYLWSPTAGLNDSTSSSPNASPATTTTYTLTVSGNGCTAMMDEMLVTVHNIPTANAGMDDTITSGASVMLNATGGILYSWSPTTGLDNSGIYNPNASPETTTTYTVHITDLFGCFVNSAVTITVVSPSFWVPTAFTPDGNGSSDVFYIRGEGIKDFEFSVYNRWGERIFFTKDILIGWDGTIQNTGDKLPEGAYVYQVTGNRTDGTPVFAKGIINLIR